MDGEDDLAALLERKVAKIIDCHVVLVVVSLNEELDAEVVVAHVKLVPCLAVGRTGALAVELQRMTACSFGHTREGIALAGVLAVLLGVLLLVVVADHPLHAKAWW